MMENDKIYLISIANKYLVKPEVVKEIFKLMDNWFEEKLIEEISHYKDINDIRRIK